MWYMIAATLVLLSLAKLGQGDPYGVDTDPYLVYRHGTGDICPPRMVCADEFNYRRTLNRVTSTRVRRIFNCRCSMNSREVCPIDDRHMIHASPIHKQYLCRPIDTFSVCNLTRPEPMIAEEAVQRSPDFHNRNYFKINCICPLHLHPPQRILGRLQSSTTYVRTRFDFQHFAFYQEHICTV